MEHAFLHKLGRVLWRGLVVTIVLLAAYVSFGRLLIAAVDDYQRPILDALNQRLPFSISATRVSGEWVSFSPELVLSGMRLHFPAGDRTPLALGEGRARLNILGSLVSGNLQVSRLRLDGLDLSLSMTPDGRWYLPGMPLSDGNLLPWLRQVLVNVEQLSLGDTRLLATLPDGRQRAMGLELRLSRDGSERLLNAVVRDYDDATRIAIAARGLGDLFAADSLEGELYLDARGLELATLPEWLPAFDMPLRAAGRTDLELWVAWEEGLPRVETRVSARDVRLSGGKSEPWEFPVSDLDFSATVQRGDNRWTLFTRDLSLGQADTRLAVPRLQVDLWGDSLRLRAEQVPLAPTSLLYARLPATPPALAQALDVLAADGQLQRVEFSLDDLNAPARGWQLSANFDRVAVASWRGAPGMREGTGFVSLSPGEGEVVLDSRDFALTFPTVYAAPLEYEDIHGKVYLGWDPAGLTLRSGLITAVDEQGPAHALFALDVPFSERASGIEMDLLVGLQDADAGHRGKYLPQVLDERLLAWLGESVDAGWIERGGFLWRGSLRLQAAQLRTVQLFFQVRDTALQYQPDWPALQSLDGLVLIDDANVSVWGERASLFDSALTQLSAEAWMTDDGSMHLAVGGEMQGPAADGLALVRQSPLAGLTAGTFDAWQAPQGELQTTLDLHLDLAGNSPAQVDVQADLANAELQLIPMGLTVEEVHARVHYNSGTGFRADELRGALWGQPLSGTLAPLPGGGPESLALDLEGSLVATAIDDWLGLGQSGLADGSAPATASIRVQAGVPPRLTVTSALQGLALDLPAPLQKPAAETWPLRLGLELSGDRRQLDLALGRRLEGALLLDGNWTLRGGNLALQDRVKPPRDGVLQLSGHVAQLSPGAWQAALAPLWEQEQGPAERPLLQVDGLLVDSLALGALDLRAVMIDAREADTGWSLAAETDWLQGELQLGPGLEQGTLQLEVLDLGRTPSGAVTPGASSPPSLPDLEVSIARLLHEGRELGQLQFRLSSDGETLRAADVTGRLAGMTLAPEAPAQLTWRGGDPARTAVAGALTFSDLGAVLQRLDYQPIVDTDSGRFELALSWPGSPRDFSLAATTGNLLLDIEEGRFLDAPATTSGTLRVVSIFNLAEIVQRLSLSHMFESGIPFDSMDGELYFHAGTVEVPELAVQGASSSFAFNAVSQLDSRELQGELVATLPVANNLPWVAALAGGLPVAAGVFVVSKVFEKQVNRFSSAIYSIGGTWDDPEVKFSRIFDTGAAPTRAAPAPDPNNPRDPNSTPGVPPAGESVVDPFAAQPEDAAAEVVGPDSP